MDIFALDARSPDAFVHKEHLPLLCGCRIDIMIGRMVLRRDKISNRECSCVSIRRIGNFEFEEHVLLPIL